MLFIIKQWDSGCLWRICSGMLSHCSVLSILKDRDGIAKVSSSEMSSGYRHLPVRAAGCVDNPFTIGSNPMLPTVEHSEPCP